MGLIAAESLEMLYCGLEVPHPEWIGGGGIRLDPVQEWGPTTLDDAVTPPGVLQARGDEVQTTADDLGLRADVSPRVLTEARRRLTTVYDGPTCPDEGERGPTWAYLLATWGDRDTWRTVAERAGMEVSG